MVVYDSKVASTSNIASSVAGIENLIAVRYDISPNSLYTRLVLQGPKLAVKCWLVNKDGSSLFTGKGKIAGTGQPSTGSLKIDPYVWFIEKYLKKGFMQYGVRRLLHRPVLAYRSYPDGNEPSPVDQS